LSANPDEFRAREQGPPNQQICRGQFSVGKRAGASYYITIFSTCLDYNSGSTAKARYPFGSSIRAERIKVRSTVKSFALITGMIVSSLTHAGTVETVFQDAALYTVKIETTTRHPYHDDAHGTVIGAGFLIDRKKGFISPHVNL